MFAGSLTCFRGSPYLNVTCWPLVYFLLLPDLAAAPTTRTAGTHLMNLNTIDFWGEELFWKDNKQEQILIINAKSKSTVRAAISPGLETAAVIAFDFYPIFCTCGWVSSCMRPPKTLPEPWHRKFSPSPPAPVSSLHPLPGVSCPVLIGWRESEGWGFVVLICQQIATDGPMCRMALVNYCSREGQIPSIR